MQIFDSNLSQKLQSDEKQNNLTTVREAAPGESNYSTQKEEEKKEEMKRKSIQYDSRRRKCSPKEFRIEGPLLQKKDLRKSLSRNPAFQYKQTLQLKTPPPLVNLSTSGSFINRPKVCKTPTGGNVAKTQRETEKKSQIALANMILKKGTTDLKKQKMFNSFDQLNVGIFIELERIKKPS
mmetsp:Transcript_28405/g.27357  ORF Transcript_28405/g.27357 Transcript_28405/m.27357 type:complete len:180 (+) Transcript_28405:479-1018(+)